MLQIWRRLRRGQGPRKKVGKPGARENGDTVFFEELEGFPGVPKLGVKCGFTPGHTLAGHRLRMRRKPSKRPARASGCVVTSTAVQGFKH